MVLARIVPQGVIDGTRQEPNKISPSRRSKVSPETPAPRPAVFCEDAEMHVEFRWAYVLLLVANCLGCHPERSAKRAVEGPAFCVYAERKLRVFPLRPGRDDNRECHSALNVSAG